MTSQYPVFPSRSPDLTPLDFHLWGYLKNKIYANIPKTRAETIHRIEEECATISAEQIEKACMDQDRRRLDCCMQLNGAFIEQYL